MCYVMLYTTMWFEYNDNVGAVLLLGICELLDDDDDVF